MFLSPEAGILENMHRMLSSWAALLPASKKIHSGFPAGLCAQQSFSHHLGNPWAVTCNIIADSVLLSCAPDVPSKGLFTKCPCGWEEEDLRFFCEDRDGSEKKGT